MLEAFFASTLLVAIAEMGDKTQLLSFALTARIKRPGPIIAGILVATLANHALAGWVGAWIAQLVSPNTMRWITAATGRARLFGDGIVLYIPGRPI